MAAQSRVARNQYAGYPLRFCYQHQGRLQPTGERSPLWKGGRAICKTQWDAAHPDYMRTYLKERYRARMADPALAALDRETSRQTAKLYRERHPDRVKVSQRKRYLKNREQDAARARKQAKEWCRTHRSEVAKRVKDWVAKHPERAKMNGRNSTARRRVRMRANPVEHFDMLAVAVRDNWRCHICGKKVTRKTLSFDHLIPVVHGGPHTMSNLAVAHRRCNSRRGPGRIPAQLVLDVSPK